MNLLPLDLLCYTFGLIGVFVLSNNPECPDNIKTCYNCDLVGTGCSYSEWSEETEEQCLYYLTAYMTVWSVVYDSVTGTCSLHECNDNSFTYKEGSVVHRKTCVTECGDFTLTMAQGHDVSAAVSYDVYLGLNLLSCLSVCLETNTSCTVVHEQTDDTCRLYTECEDICEISEINDASVNVFKRQCEPEGASNVAFNKSTSMSSLWTDWGEPHIYRSPLGNDGDTTQDKYMDTCFVTDGEIGPWWRVDLGATYRIHRVVIYNRMDCCYERAHDLVLSVGRTETDLVAQDYLQQLYSTFPFTLPSNTTARYVQLGINATYLEFFHLCEVQVFGIPDCGSPANLEHGSVSATDTTIYDSAKYTCNTGYTLSGNSTRKCQLDFTWSGAVPTCYPVECGPLLNPSNGNVTSPGTTYLNVATYSCLTGFNLTGSATRVCLANGRWESTTPVCDQIQCADLGNPQNVIVTMTTGRTYGSQASYSCQNGFNLVGSNKARCQSDGHWDGTAPTCIPVDCETLADPLHGSINISDGTTFGKHAKYSCNNGYDIMGSNRTTCTADGTWSHSPPECIQQTTTAEPSTSAPEPVTSTSTPEPVTSTSTQEPVTSTSTPEPVTSTTTSEPITSTSTPEPVTSTTTSEPATSTSTPEPVTSTTTSEPATSTSTPEPVTSTTTSEPITSTSTPEPVTSTTTSEPATSTSTPEPVTSTTSEPVTSTSTTTSEPVTSTSTQEPVTSTTTSEPVTSTSTQKPVAITSASARIYIMPCLCYPNKTFINMTMEEIIAELVADTKIDPKHTTLSLSKLNSRADDRTSSKILGSVGITVLSTVFGLLFCLDLLTLWSKLKA